MRKFEFLPEGWYYFDFYEFIMTHCVYYSKAGRQKVGKFLKQNPLSMQIDGYYSSLAKQRKLIILLQLKNHTVHQDMHTSSIQNDDCYLCDHPPSRKNLVYSNQKLATIVIPIVISALTVCFAFSHVHTNYKGHHYFD